MKKLFLIYCLLAAAANTRADELAPFTTDGCSMFPNGNPLHKSLWLQCCIAHDLAYWKGGTRPERLAADLALEQCVKNVGEPKIANLMLTGVRAGGTPYLPSTYRWGYGWSLTRGYQPLTNEEQSQVIKQLNSLDTLLHNSIDSLQSTPSPIPENPVKTSPQP